MTALPDDDRATPGKTEKVYFDRVDGPAMLAYDKELGCMVVAIVVRDGNNSKVLTMPEEAAQALVHWLGHGT